MYAPAVQISWSRVTPWLAAAIRPRPRLVASARMVASSAFSLSHRSPVRRLVKAAAKPVARLTSCSTSVMRTAGSIASSRSAKARASGGAAALTGVTRRRPVPQLDALELAAPEPEREALQPPVELLPASSEPLLGRPGQPEPRRGPPAAGPGSHPAAAPGTPSPAVAAGTAAGGSR